MRRHPAGQRTSDARSPVEWPTLVLACAVYAGWMATTWFQAVLPFWLLILLGGWFIAWHGSLQHETIHGHPTRSRRLNTLIGMAPLSLWLPYACYRRDHLAHHAAEAVTDPSVDPESRYLLPGNGISGRLAHASAKIQSTLAGRLILGPPIGIASFLADEIVRAARNPTKALHRWAPHAAAVIALMAWLSVCHLSIGRYVLAFVYPGAALSLLRSYAEHRASPIAGHRVAVVERAGPLALLFLHNNLHAVHHAAPGLPWYRIPAYYRRHRDRVLQANGGLLYRGYTEIAWRYAFRAHDRLMFPRSDITSEAV